MIFWFSGTGNSRAVATFLEKELQEQTVDIAKAVRKKEFSYNLENEERVGFVFPVYFWGLPSIVSYFLQQITFKNSENCYVYGVITCGGGIGAADRQMRNILTKKNCTLQAVFPIVMPDNYVVMFQAPTTEEAEKILKKSERTMKEIAEKIRKQTKGNWSGAKELALSTVMQPLYRKGRKTKKFYADDVCLNCGKCAGICPVKAIRMKDGKPVWVKEQCVFCMACINRCPVQAIQYGKKTLKKGRYEHPEIRNKW